jgi:hypothetical protein
MAYRLVRAHPREDRLPDLRDRIERGEIEGMDPFGEVMTASLRKAKFDPETGEAVWVEEDYCTPPLAMEREAVLDDYFDDLVVVEADVDETEGWERIDDLAPLWTQLATRAP